MFYPYLCVCEAYGTGESMEAKFLRGAKSYLLTLQQVIPEPTLFTAEKKKKKKTSLTKHRSRFQKQERYYPSM